MDFDALDTIMQATGQPAFRRKQVYHAVTHELVGGWDEITTLPKQLRATLEADLPFDTVRVDHEERSDDGSVKLRLVTHDGYPLEAVLMRFDTPGTKSSGRFTACLSSQSGCALACTFCATGAMGLGRNLTRFEILDQLLVLSRIRSEQTGERRGIDNIVMMGMGEPFHNYDEVLAACRLMNDRDGMGLAARRIAISTVGWVPGIEKLAQENIQVKLALSLHAPNDELRDQLMPVNKRFPIERLMEACRTYRRTTRRRIFVEYLMLEGVNDSLLHAGQLAQLLRAPGFHVNLIAYNPTGSGYRGSSEETVARFAKALEDYGVTTSYRISRGRDISAACGQLAAPLAAAKAAAREARAARAAAKA